MFDQRSSDYYIYSYDKIIQFLFSLFKGARGNEYFSDVFGQFGALMGAPGVTMYGVASLDVAEIG